MDLLSFIVITAGPVVLALAITIALNDRTQREGKWHRTFFARFRRYVNGEWQYRDIAPPTQCRS